MGFQCENCSACCGPVPVSRNELKKIQQYIKKMPKRLEKLKEQSRGPLACMFVDKDTNKCAIYSVRPTICRMYGYYQGMACFTNPEYATKSKAEGNKMLGLDKAAPVGILSITVTWKNILKI